MMSTVVEGRSLHALEPVLYETVGSIQGTVVYQYDSTRPWRYARYYVKNRNKGELAEAVVALTNVTHTKDSRSSENPSTVVIDQKNFQFVPETVAIRAGERVKFLNSDKELHNIKTVHLRQSFNVNMPAGGQHIATFKHASGLQRPYRIGCVYHSAMRAWVFVFAHPHFQVTKTDGRFRLEGIPPGEYKLEMSHPAGGLSWSRTVKVEAAKTKTVEIHVSPDNLRQEHE